MQAATKCTLRTALIMAALVIPGGCLALLAVALVRRACCPTDGKAPTTAAPAAAAPDPAA
jgi:hypothetical protein